jgi:hypothetical protein
MNMRFLLWAAHEADLPSTVFEGTFAYFSFPWIDFKNTLMKPTASECKNAKIGERVDGDGMCLLLQPSSPTGLATGF